MTWLDIFFGLLENNENNELQFNHIYRMDDTHINPSYIHLIEEVMNKYITNN